MTFLLDKMTARCGWAYRPKDEFKTFERAHLEAPLPRFFNRLRDLGVQPPTQRRSAGLFTSCPYAMNEKPGEWRTNGPR